MAAFGKVVKIKIVKSHAHGCKKDKECSCKSPDS